MSNRMSAFNHVTWGPRQQRSKASSRNQNLIKYKDCHRYRCPCASCLSRAGTRPKVALWLGPLSHSLSLLCGHGPMWAMRCVCECVRCTCSCRIISILPPLGIVPAGPTLLGLLLELRLINTTNTCSRPPLRK